MKPPTTPKPTATNAVATATATTGAKIPPRLRVLFLVLLATVPIAWLAAWGSEARKNVVGEPDVTIAAPDAKPVISLGYDPVRPGVLLVSAGDDAPGGGIVLWESTDKADSELPKRDAGAFGQVPFRRSRTLRAFGKKQRGYAAYSPDGKYIATWSGKLTVWRNDAYHSAPLYDVKGETFFVGWNRTEIGTGFMYWIRDGYAVVAPHTRKQTQDQRGCYAKDYDLTELTDGFTPERPTEPGIYATPDKNTLRFVNRKAGRSRQILKAGAANVVVSEWSNDGKQIAFADADGWVYRFTQDADGKFVPATKLSRFAHAQNPGKDAPKVTALAFAPDGKTLATGGTDGMVFLWRL